MEISADTFNKFALGTVAIISMVVGPLLQWRIAVRQATLQEAIAARQAALQESIAKRQVADSIATKRHTWINELREDIAELIGAYTTYLELQHLQSRNIGDEAERWNRFLSMKDAIKSSAIIANRIDLRLVGSEPGHQRLLDAMVKLKKFVSDVLVHEDLRDAEVEEWDNLRLGVLDSGKRLLTEEWRRVKNGEV